MSTTKLGGKATRLRSIWSLLKSSSFLLPAKCDVLIFDSVGSDDLLTVFHDLETTVLPVRGEKIFLPIVALSLVSWRACSLGIKSAYILRCIEWTKATVVITHIDNRREFYELSRRLGGAIKTAFVQNGIRGISADIFETLRPSLRYRVDYMFVFSKAIGQLYAENIEGRFIPVGALRNNAIAPVLNSRVKMKKREVVFISQWIKSLSSDPFLEQSNVFWDEFYAAERLVIPLISNWCKKNSYTLVILGRSVNEPDEEQAYFQSLATVEFDFKPASAYPSAYYLVDDAHAVTFIDSTLGYECLARGARVAAFTIRDWLLDLPKPGSGRKFGWPVAFSDEGTFWTNTADTVTAERILDFACHATDDDWSRVRQKVAEEVMIYDKGNAMLRQTVMDALSTCSIEEGGS